MFIIGAVEGAWYAVREYAPFIALVILALGVCFEMWRRRRKH